MKICAIHQIEITVRIAFELLVWLFLVTLFGLLLSPFWIFATAFGLLFGFFDKREAKEILHWLVSARFFFE